MGNHPSAALLGFQRKEKAEERRLVQYAFSPLYDAKSFRCVMGIFQLKDFLLLVWFSKGSFAFLCEHV